MSTGCSVACPRAHRSCIRRLDACFGREKPLTARPDLGRRWVMAIRWLLALVLLITAAAPASAAKWAGGCPKVKSKLSFAGHGYYGTPWVRSRLYEHVGHEMSFFLKETDVAKWGGFSTDPD